MNGNKPTFSIITATLNAGAELRKTLDSLQVQTIRDFEYIVVDGGSSDFTVSLLQQESDFSVRWVSESDEGISDAFNKGVRMAKGEWVLFLGAGDCLASATVLENVYRFVLANDMPPFFYGDAIYDYAETRRRVHRNYQWKKFCRYSCIPHQAMFLKRAIFDQYGFFDLHYRICMDYEHTARFIRDIPPLYMDMEVAVMPRTGVSTNPWKTHKEMNRVRREHRLATPISTAMFWVFILAKAAYCFVLRKPW